MVSWQNSINRINEREINLDAEFTVAFDDGQEGKYASKQATKELRHDHERETDPVTIFGNVAHHCLLKLNRAMTGMPGVKCPLTQCSLVSDVHKELLSMTFQG